MIRTATAFILSGFIVLSPIAVAESLEDFVEKASKNLLAQINQERESFEDNPGVLYAEVNNMLSPLVDFETITRGVMGRYYKDATREQRTEFQRKLHMFIIELYTKTLVVFKSKSIQVIPLKSTPTSTAMLSMKVTAQDGGIFTLIYNMVKKETQWKVRNIIVNGVNLGLIYRNQFTLMMTENGHDIDAVIHAWKAPANEKS